MLLLILTTPVLLKELVEGGIVDATVLLIPMPIPPVTINDPTTIKPPPIPTPPATVNAAVLLSVAVVLFLILTGPSNLVLPPLAIWKNSEGVVVPIPTLPLFNIVIFSVETLLLDVRNPNVPLPSVIFVLYALIAPKT